MIFYFLRRPQDPQRTGQVDMKSSVVPPGTSLLYIQATQGDMLQSLLTTQAAHGRLLDTLMGDMADLRIIYSPTSVEKFLVFCSTSWTLWLSLLWQYCSVTLFGERLFFCSVVVCTLGIKLFNMQIKKTKKLFNMLHVLYIFCLSLV